MTLFVFGNGFRGCCLVKHRICRRCRRMEINCGYHGRVTMNRLSDIAPRSIRRLAITVIVLGAILFLSAGSTRSWEAWFLLPLQARFWTFFLISPQIVRDIRKVPLEQGYLQREQPLSGLALRY